MASFFEDNFYLVFTLLQDAVTDFNNTGKGKRDPKYMEQIVWLLQAVIEYLPGMIGRQWQTKALYTLICNLLYRENRMELRMKGLEIYLAFLTALRPPEEEWAQHKDVLALLGQCLYFQPYVLGGESVSFAVNPLEAPADVAVWLPGGTVNESDADAYMKKVFDFISKRQDPVDFSFWFNMLKLHVLPVLYPKVFQQMKLLPEDQRTGFPDCPAKLQRRVHEYLALWFQDPKKVTVLWATPQNVQLLLEIFSYAVNISTTDADVAVAALQSYHGLFFTATPVPELVQRLNQYRSYFLKKLPVVFSKNTEGNTLTQHVKLCREAVRLVMDCGKTISTLEKPVIDVILAIPLNALTALFAGRTSSALAVEISRDLVNATIRLWIIAQPEVSWGALQNVMAFVFGESAAAIDVVRDLFLQMTLIVQRFYYPQRAVKESKRQLGAEGLKTASHVSRPPDWRPPRDVPAEADPEFEKMSWTPAMALSMWQNVRDLFLKMNTITQPTHHAKVVEALVCVSDYLLQQEAGVPFESLSNPQQPKPLELIDMFGPILCEALQLPSEFDAGRALAAGGLCRLFCRQTDAVPVAILQYIYGMLAKELEENPLSQTSVEILANTGAIFALDLPGAVVLIPTYIQALKVHADRDASKDTDLMPVRGCIWALCSLVCFPSYFKNLQIPRAAGPAMTSPELKGEITSLLSKMTSPTSKFVCKPETIFMILCGLTAFVLNEARCGDSLSFILRNTVPQFVSTIIARVFDSSDDVAIGASHCLATLANDQAALPPSLVVQAVQGLADACVAYFTSVSSGDGKVPLRPLVAIAALECLEEWVLAVPASVVEQPAINKALFNAIELGLLGMSLPKGPSAHEKKGGKSKAPVHTFATLRAAPLHGSKEVAEVAEVLLRSLLNLQDQWPGPGGPELTGTALTEGSQMEDVASTYYFANGSIMSLVPLTAPEKERERPVRLIVRDEADRYAWDAQVVFSDPEGSVKKLPTAGGGGGSLAPPPSSSGGAAKSYKRKPREPPSWVPDENIADVDKVEEMLKYLSEVYEDCPFNPDAIVVADEIKTLVEQTAWLMDRQQEVIASKVDLLQQESSKADDGLNLPTAVPVSDAVHWSRLLLSHFNMVDYDQRSMFSMLDCGMPLQRSVNTLDTKRAREAFKVGLIYVKRGQDNQEQILKNETRSQYYDAFAKALAWEVNMATHKGYNGGLDQTKFLTGTTAPYFSTPRLELMFHDLTLMPTDTKDEQQIHKKRHVGNDVVNVVWSEHVRDYDPSTISTQFNCAHIICYPLANGLTRVQICRKEEQVYPLFGPLLHNMCVTSALLPLLARQTCLNANRNFTSHKHGYLMPFPNRQRDVAQLLSRYKQENADYSKTILTAFGGAPPPEKK